MNRRLFSSLAMLLLPLGTLFVPRAAFAQGEQMGYTSYYFTDSGGNTVATTSFNLAKKILRKTVFLLDLEVDNVTVPPVSAVTGATRPQRQSSKPFEKTRGQAIVGIEQGMGPTTSLALNAYRSQEIDYVSNSAIAALTQELFQKNVTLMLRGQVILDEVGKILDDGSVENQNKTSYWAMASLTQLLTPATVLTLSYDGLFHDGFLSDPYRQVRVFDQNNAFVSVDELHPDTRLRQAGTLKLNHSIDNIGASLMTSYRYYLDDWDVTSHTADVQFNKYVLKDLILRFNYRYYQQGSASFYEEQYVGEGFQNDEFRTGDYKLQAFNSNNFGLSLSLLFRELANSKKDFEFLENASVELRYFRYFNTLDFSANIYQLNINFGI